RSCSKARTGTARSCRRSGPPTTPRGRRPTGSQRLARSWTSSLRSPQSDDVPLSLVVHGGPSRLENGMRTLLVGVATAALIASGTSVALAQDDTPAESRQCQNAKIAEGEALAAHRDAEKAERDFRKAAQDGDDSVKGADD